MKKNKQNNFKPELIINNQKPINARAVERYKKKFSAICKIMVNETSGTGFFCELKIRNNFDKKIELMKFLFTNNHIIDKKDSPIKIEYEKEIKEINPKNRFFSTSLKYDYTAIEILDSDNFNNFFKVEKNINIDNPEEEYINDEFVIIQNPGGNGVSFAEGYLNKIQNEYQIIHSISTESGSSGSPICLDTRNLKIIGIHCGKEQNLNKGILMKHIIEDIEKQFFNYKEKKKILNERRRSNNPADFYRTNIMIKTKKEKKDPRKIFKKSKTIKFQPIGSYEYNNKDYPLYEEEQFEENKEFW